MLTCCQYTSNFVVFWKVSFNTGMQIYFQCSILCLVRSLSSSRFVGELMNCTCFTNTKLKTQTFCGFFFGWFYTVYNVLSQPHNSKIKTVWMTNPEGLWSLLWSFIWSLCLILLCCCFLEPLSMNWFTLFVVCFH